MNQDKDLLFQTAKKYVEKGLKIIAVHSPNCENSIKRGKAPTQYGWQKKSQGWDDLRAEMERVWAREGACNIGLVTGKASGLVVVDIDEPGWFDEHEMHLGSPVIERSPSGGLHLYYKYPQGLSGDIRSRSSAARIFKGVDILADGGSQVVTWPSVHQSGQGMYTFDRGLDLLDALEEADELPRWIVDEMLTERKEERVRESDVKGGQLDLHAARLALRSFPPAIEGAGGDLQTLKAALIGRDYGLSAKEVYGLMREEYNGRCSPPWSDQDLADKVKNAFKYAQRGQGNMSIEHAFDEEPTVTEAAPVLAYSKKHAVHNADIFLQKMKGVLDCFDGQFVHYDTKDKRWRVISDGAVESLIFHDMPADVRQTIKASMFSDVRKIIRMQLSKGEGIPDVHWRGNDDRRGIDFITVNNGILDVQTGELLEHSKDWFCFHSLPMVYREDASCEEFLRFLDSVWDGDQELIESLRLWMGYCLLTSCSMEKFAVFHGASRAGKSTLASVIESIVGRENTASTSLSLIGSDFGLENLMGRKLCVFQDAERASLDRMGVATERIKSLASNDPVGINRKGQSVVFQRLGVKIAFVCNKLPNFLNDENALTNRMIVFPFSKSFMGQEDTGLKERLGKETEGIFNWALVGARRLLRGDKLFTAEKGREALQKLTEQLDSVEGFVAEGLEFTGQAHNFVSSNDLWAAYKEWCKDAGRHPKHKQRFCQDISSHKAFKSLFVRANNIRGYQGIKVVTEVFSAVEEEPCPF
jgi:P4 family phage/plasmid primase-like protien